MSASLEEAASVLRRVIEEARRGLVEREGLVEAIVLAAIAGEHLLVIGPPGTAKSEAARRVARGLGGKCFEYLIGRFTEPSEIFGPVDLRKLREGTVETATAGMLPEADIAFLDEIFLGSTAILNTLLGILNERVFQRGHTRLACPLRICVGASNALPRDEALAAFADRFLVRVFLDPLSDPMIEELLLSGWELGITAPASGATLEHLDALSRAATQVDLTAVRPVLAHAIRILRSAGITLTDRRAVRVQRLIAAATVLAGRTQATEADVWPLILAIPTKEEQTAATEQLRDLLSKTENRTLTAIAEQASLGPMARAARIASAGRRLLEVPPQDAAARDVWRLKLEGVAREIDAGFVPESMPQELAQVRTQIVEALGAGS
jgi:MoxR-like ATPase